MTTWILITLAIFLIVRRVFLGYSGTARKFKVLARREVALISSTAEVMFPADGAIPFSGIEADLPGFADRFLASLPPNVRWQIRALFMLFEHGTLLFPGPGWTGMRRFSSLTLEQRELVLQRWSQSSKFFRQICFTALRAVLTMGYLGHPVVMRHLGLAPYAMESPLCEADLLYPAIGQHPDQIPYSEQDLGPPSDGTPLDIEGPLHPDYAIPAPVATTSSTHRSTNLSSETIS
ncbi:MAG: hypothetical protein IH881_05970 [Myxococcales bacterium]|nr:hypothetical protein [Myxococcales bacterium]